MYYISINKEKVAIITTSRKQAAKHIGVHSVTLSRAFKSGTFYECSSGNVFITDSILRQSRGFGRVRNGSNVRNLVRKP